MREELLGKHASLLIYTTSLEALQESGSGTVEGFANFTKLISISMTVTVAEPSAQTVLTSTPVGISEGSTTYRTVNLSGAQLQPVQYINSQVEGNVMYGGARYLVPVQQRPAESFVYLSQAPRVVQPMYVQNVQPVSVSSVSSVDETDVYRQININGQMSVCSQLSSPIKSPEPSESELVETSSIREEVVDLREIKNGLSQIKTEIIDVEPVAKMDNRFFGELLAEVYRKNSDIHTCISEHVAKIRGRKHLLDPTIDYKVEKEEIESLIPKGVSELTKQQIRYLLQTRITADKTMRLLMATFSSLREELVHMQDDLRAAVKESNNTQRTLESQVLNLQSKDPSKDFRIKELEGSKRALEQENELLRKKLAGQCSSSTVQIKTQELSREYEQMLRDLREEKDRELKNLRLLSKLEQRESLIKHQEEEIRRLKQQKTDNSSSTTRTVVTKRYMNQYPILGLLSDEYQYTPPIKEDRTVIIESTGVSKVI
ncbi:Protein POF1B [Labeo rohita]|uniref:Protein POF1B n=1 Tax=Labeo rohita TaxID=84645 RepID=A0ABQ8LN62_LABRO|nr:Protein POF1B [Labeo rohita]